MIENLLEQLRPKTVFYENGPEWVRSIFKTANSFDWYCKSRKKVLGECGAMCRIGRDWYINGEKFEKFLLSEFKL
jgi:hypothetical protein